MSDLEHPQLKTTIAESSVMAVTAAKPMKHFKLRLTLPGKNIGGEWLCRLTGSALAYQNYCGMYGTPRIFSWYLHSDGLSYLEDQEGNFLSYETTANCLYMSTRHYATAWKIENGRLVRVFDNAVVTWKEHQSWPLSSDHFLMALPPSGEALTVEPVDAELPMDRILEKMIPVFKKRHEPVDSGMDRYQYTTNPARPTPSMPTKMPPPGSPTAKANWPFLR